MRELVVQGIFIKNFYSPEKVYSYHVALPKI